MKVRTLRGLTTAQVTTLSNLLGTAAQAWTKAWADTGGDKLLRACEAASEQNFEAWTVDVCQWQWFALEQISSCQVWVAAPLDVVHELGIKMGWLPKISARDDDSIGHVLAERAWQDLLARLGTALGAQPTPSWSSAPFPCLDAPFSGAAMAHLVCGEVPVIVAIAGDRVASLAPSAKPAQASPSPIQPVAAALAEHHIRLACSLRATAIDLGTLTSLSAGDVLVLEHRLDEPLYLATDDGASLCRAYLGKRDSSLAIELTPETSFD